jgi:adenylate cyclase class 2
MPYIETEIKLHVPDLAAMEARLNAAGAELAAPRVFEANVRYDDADGRLRARNIVLRLRQDTRVRLTYKEDLASADGSSDSHSRFEAEVEISDFDAMATILDRLGYRPALRYEKYRTTYHLAGAEVVLDELPMGNFMEIEGEPAAIQQAIALLDIGHLPRMPASYVEVFERLRRALHLPFTDLTFANFDGLYIAPEMLKDEALWR